MAGALMLLIGHFTLRDESHSGKMFLMLVLDDNFNFFFAVIGIGAISISDTVCKVMV